jgi:anaerobic selenocysteine-containing dehydrogenase
VQSHSRTQNCKWLSEIYHDNPAWINTVTAKQLGISDGDQIKVKASAGETAVDEITTKARVTEGVVPGVIAISHHCGHWEYGEYASGKRSHSHVYEADCKYKWWNESGVHPNWIIPNKGDPIGGAMRWMDTVVTVTKV